MSEINHGGPAFPTVAGQTVYSNGMTLRDWFAGHALAAMIAKAPFFDRDGELGSPIGMVQFKKDMAESAYFYADAMLKARAGRADSGDRDYNDGCWHRIPDVRPESVHPQSRVEMEWTVKRDGESQLVSSVRMADDFSWGSDSCAVVNERFRVVEVFTPSGGSKK